MRIDISRVEFSNNDLRRNIKVPREFTAELAEDVGYHIGDGYMKSWKNKWSFKYDFCYTGHSIDDRDYIFSVLLPRKLALFNLTKYRISERLDRKELSIRFRSKAILTFYKYTTGVQESPKNNICVPKWIFSNKNFTKAFLRGLFDSDGSVTFLKKYKQLNYYPVIRLCTISKLLFNDVISLLSNLNIKCAKLEYKRLDKRYADRIFMRYDIDINGVKGLNNWMEKIGFRNPKHLSKINIWKRQGYCEPYSSTPKRLLIISEPGKI